MDREQLYQLLDPEAPGTIALLFRAVRYTALWVGIGISFAETVEPWREAYGQALAAGFQIVCTFFIAEYLLHLAAAPGAPGAAHHHARWRSRIAWAASLSGMFEFLGVVP